MKTVLICLLLSLNLSVGAQNLELPSFSKAPLALEILGNGTLSTSLNERDFAISPDGKEIYFTVSTPKSTFQTIVVCKQVRPGEWTKPEVASFAGTFSDLEPAFSADGQTLYFASNRPVSGSVLKDFDIWKVQRGPSGWGEAINLGSPINTNSDEFYPSIAKNGNLYYTATYKGGPGREDIYVSVYAPTGYQVPTPLDTAVNSKFYEFNAFVDPYEQYILFTSYGRKDDMGGGDLYISVKNATGEWQPAKNVKRLNSRQLDYCPYVSPDGKTLFLTSDRHSLPTHFADAKTDYKSIETIWSTPLNGSGNIYWIDFENLWKDYK